MLILGNHPYFFAIDISSNFLAVPSGFLVSKLILIFNPNFFIINSAYCLIVLSFPVPILIKESLVCFFKKNIHASATSST